MTSSEMRSTLEVLIPAKEARELTDIFKDFDSKDKVAECEALVNSFWFD